TTPSTTLRVIHNLFRNKRTIRNKKTITTSLCIKYYQTKNTAKERTFWSYVQLIVPERTSFSCSSSTNRVPFDRT
ncbi:hypothetical protein ACJX0J_028456, partial [Zea mays]